MPRASVDASALLDWGVAASALPGQAQSGDAHLVKAVATGVLVAVVDGLGHGAEAATAARTAVHTLAEHAAESVLALLQRCHVALKGSRGVVMSLAFANGHRSEEHTSELQSRFGISYAVFCLKKKEFTQARCV